ncbi:hypothetical protein C8P66_11721 [Humitalea rosea]|uniref:Uncharacterized protein n=1 Tax=Humitalea rosea TaxID=990373 RepID=A0A2W7I7Y0_9PROT|nr:hypothetical protein [Humitalea rosea]PZW42996.1 hypothetical protein C8P66_11721 [Humitalea rosea]
MSAYWSGTEDGARASLQPGTIPGSWQLGGPDGPLIAAICFRDRTEALAIAARSPQAAQVALTHLRALALRREGIADPRALDLAVLHLAGAEADDTLPGFAETALCVARGAGLGLSEIAKAPAAEIDAMARALLPAAEDGTTRIVFAIAPAHDPAGEIEARLGALLRRAAVTRAMATPEPAAAPVTEPAAAPPAPPAAEAPMTWVAPQPGRSEGGMPAAAPPPAGPRPFRLAPAAGTARSAASTVPMRSRTIEAVWRPAPAAVATPGQMASRPPLALVTPAWPDAEAAPRLVDDPALPAVGPVSLTGAGLPGSAPRAAGLGLGLDLGLGLGQAPGRPASVPASSAQTSTAALRLPGWPPAWQAAPPPAADAPQVAPDVAPPWQAASAAVPLEGLAFADALAAALEDEADLRGLAP